MTQHKKLTERDMRKLLIKQQMAEQRYQLKEQLEPLKATTHRLCNLLTGNQQSGSKQGKILVVSGLALLIAMLSKRKGVIGKVARFAVVNYPGMLYRLTK